MLKRETITIQTHGGPTTIEAWVDLELAAHETVGDPLADQWTITHVPTGMSFGSAGRFSFRHDALAAVRDLLATGIRWADTAEVARNGKTIREIMARHGAVGGKTDA